MGKMNKSPCCDASVWTMSEIRKFVNGAMELVITVCNALDEAFVHGKGVLVKTSGLESSFDLH
jgi:hypothetical protein